jgi:hypothetical protein
MQSLSSVENSEPLEEKEEVFQLKKFLGFFEKRNILIKGIYVLDERVVFIHIFIKKHVKNLFLYVSSKFNIAVDGIFKFPKYDLNSSDEDASFSGQEKMIRSFFEGQLDRLKKSSIKLMWFHKKRIIYITRHNEVDIMDVATNSESGFFYLTEWEYFFKHSDEIWEEIGINESGLMRQCLNVTSDIDIIKTAQKAVSILNDKNKVQVQLNQQNMRIENLVSKLNGEVPKVLADLGSVVQQEVINQCFKIYTLTSEMEQINKIL